MLFRPTPLVTLLQPCLIMQMRWATKKSGGSTSNTRSSKPKYLGFKQQNGPAVIPGNIILRQRGTQWHPGTGVGIGKDHTLFSLIKGRVVVHYDLATQKRFVSVNDGTLPSLPSKAEMKRRLIATIDSAHYLTLDSKQRYDYVFEKIAELTNNMDKQRKIDTLASHSVSGRRRCDLIDLTLL